MNKEPEEEKPVQISKWVEWPTRALIIFIFLMIGYAAIIGVRLIIRWIT